MLDEVDCGGAVPQSTPLLAKPPSSLLLSCSPSELPHCVSNVSEEPFVTADQRPVSGSSAQLHLKGKLCTPVQHVRSTMSSSSPTSARTAHSTPNSSPRLDLSTSLLYFPLDEDTPPNPPHLSPSTPANTAPSHAPPDNHSASIVPPAPRRSLSPSAVVNVPSVWEDARAHVHSPSSPSCLSPSLPTPVRSSVPPTRESVTVESNTMATNEDEDAGAGVGVSGGVSAGVSVGVTAAVSLTALSIDTTHTGAAPPARRHAHAHAQTTVPAPMSAARPAEQHPRTPRTSAVTGADVARYPGLPPRRAVARPVSAFGPRAGVLLCGATVGVDARVGASIGGGVGVTHHRGLPTTGNVSGRTFVSIIPSQMQIPDTSVSVPACSRPCNQQQHIHQHQHQHQHPRPLLSNPYQRMHAGAPPQPTPTTLGARLAANAHRHQQRQSEHHKRPQSARATPLSPPSRPSVSSRLSRPPQLPVNPLPTPAAPVFAAAATAPVYPPPAASLSPSLVCPTTASHPRRPAPVAPSLHSCYTATHRPYTASAYRHPSARRQSARAVGSISHRRAHWDLRAAAAVSGSVPTPGGAGADVGLLDGHSRISASDAVADAVAHSDADPLTSLAQLPVYRVRAHHPQLVAQHVTAVAVHAAAAAQAVHDDLSARNVPSGSMRGISRPRRATVPTRPATACLARTAASPLRHARTRGSPVSSRAASVTPVQPRACACGVEACACKETVQTTLTSHASSTAAAAGSVPQDTCVSALLDAPLPLSPLLDTHIYLRLLRAAAANTRVSTAHTPPSGSSPSAHAAVASAAQALLAPLRANVVAASRYRETPPYSESTPYSENDKVLSSPFPPTPSHLASPGSPDTQDGAPGNSLAAVISEFRAIPRTLLWRVATRVFELVCARVVTALAQVEAATGVPADASAVAAGAVGTEEHVVAVHADAADGCGVGGGAVGEGAGESVGVSADLGACGLSAVLQRAHAWVCASVGARTYACTCTSGDIPPHPLSPSSSTSPPLSHPSHPSALSPVPEEAHPAPASAPASPAALPDAYPTAAVAASRAVFLTAVSDAAACEGPVAGMSPCRGCGAHGTQEGVASGADVCGSGDGSRCWNRTSTPACAGACACACACGCSDEYWRVWARVAASLCVCVCWDEWVSLPALTLRGTRTCGGPTAAGNVLGGSDMLSFAKRQFWGLTLPSSASCASAALSPHPSSLAPLHLPPHGAVQPAHTTYPMVVSESGAPQNSLFPLPEAVRAPTCANAVSRCLWEDQNAEFRNTLRENALIPVIDTIPNRQLDSSSFAFLTAVNAPASAPAPASISMPARPLPLPAPATPAQGSLSLVEIESAPASHASPLSTTSPLADTHALTHAGPLRSVAVSVAANSLLPNDQHVFSAVLQRDTRGLPRLTLLRADGQPLQRRRRGEAADPYSSTRGPPAQCAGPGISETQSASPAEEELPLFRVSAVAASAGPGRCRTAHSLPSGASHAVARPRTAVRKNADSEATHSMKVIPEDPREPSPTSPHTAAPAGALVAAYTAMRPVRRLLPRPATHTAQAAPEATDAPYAGAAASAVSNALLPDLSQLLALYVGGSGKTTAHARTSVGRARAAARAVRAVRLATVQYVRNRHAFLQQRQRAMERRKMLLMEKSEQISRVRREKQQELDIMQRPLTGVETIQNMPYTPHISTKFRPSSPVSVAAAGAVAAGALQRDVPAIAYLPPATYALALQQHASPHAQSPLTHAGAGAASYPVVAHPSAAPPSALIEHNADADVISSLPSLPTHPRGYLILHDTTPLSIKQRRARAQRASAQRRARAVHAHRTAMQRQRGEAHRWYRAQVQWLLEYVRQLHATRAAMLRSHAEQVHGPFAQGDVLGGETAMTVTTHAKTGCASVDTNGVHACRAASAGADCDVGADAIATPDAVAPNSSSLSSLTTPPAPGTTSPHSHKRRLTRAPTERLSRLPPGKHAKGTNSRSSRVSTRATATEERMQRAAAARASTARTAQRQADHCEAQLAELMQQQEQELRRLAACAAEVSAGEADFNAAVQQYVQLASGKRVDMGKYPVEDKISHIPGVARKIHKPDGFPIRPASAVTSSSSFVPRVEARVLPVALSPSPESPLARAPPSLHAASALRLPVTAHSHAPHAPHSLAAVLGDAAAHTTLASRQTYGAGVVRDGRSTLTGNIPSGNPVFPGMGVDIFPPSGADMGAGVCVATSAPIDALAHAPPRPLQPRPFSAVRTHPVSTETHTSLYSVRAGASATAREDASSFLAHAYARTSGQNSKPTTASTHTRLCARGDADAQQPQLDTHPHTDVPMRTRRPETTPPGPCTAQGGRKFLRSGDWERWVELSRVTVPQAMKICAEPMQWRQKEANNLMKSPPKPRLVIDTRTFGSISKK